jgi:hypothetical protein
MSPVPYVLSTTLVIDEVNKPLNAQKPIFKVCGQIVNLLEKTVKPQA